MIVYLSGLCKAQISLGEKLATVIQYFGFQCAINYRINPPPVMFAFWDSSVVMLRKFNRVNRFFLQVPTQAGMGTYLLRSQDKARVILTRDISCRLPFLEQLEARERKKYILRGVVKRKERHGRWDLSLRLFLPAAPYPTYPHRLLKLQIKYGRSNKRSQDYNRVNTLL